MQVVLLVLSTLFLFSCAGFDKNLKQQCETKNWSAEGQADALAGKLAGSELLNKCISKFKTPATNEEYMTGYEQGQQQFCTFDYGLYVGRQGRDYNKTCTPSIEASFLAGYSQGKLEFEYIAMAKEKLKLIRQAREVEESKLRGKMKCDENSDCKIPVKCKTVHEPGLPKRCGGSGKSCTFDSDCTVKGKCIDLICKWN